MLKPLFVIPEHPPVIIKLAVPFVAPRKLAEIWTANSTVERDLDQSEDSIRGYVATGNIPSFHIGKRLAINLVQYAYLDAASLPYPLQIEYQLLVPSLPISSFVAYTGFPVGSVLTWIKKGYLPTVGLGKHPMIVLPELQQRCQEWTSQQWAALVPRSQPLVGA